MTLRQLLALATTTLADVPHHPAITPELCAAICWVESAGDPRAKGDWDAERSEHLAIGLAQFHLKTFIRFESPCGSKHGGKARFAVRDCAKCSMRTLIREMNHVEQRCSQSLTAPEATDLTPYFANFHNTGKVISKRTAYVLRVKRAMRELAALSRKPPASSLKSAASSRKRGTPK